MGNSNTRKCKSPKVPRRRLLHEEDNDFCCKTRRRASCAIVVQRPKSVTVARPMSNPFVDDGFSQQYGKGRILRCLYDYKRTCQNELEFQEGDRLAVLQELPTHVKALHLKTNAQGFVSNKYLQPELTDEDIKADWFFGDISRENAQKLLLKSCNEAGAFLIRTSEPLDNGYPSRYTLDVKDWNDVKQKFQVRYYRIWTMEKECGFYISNNSSFKSLTEFVTSNSDFTSELCYPLLEPCKKPKEKKVNRHESFDMLSRKKQLLEVIQQLDDDLIDSGEVSITIKNF